MTICKKILLFLIAVLVINQSIDLDNITFSSTTNYKGAGYDDPDSIVEWIVENMTGDSHNLHDAHDDTGMAHHKGTAKHNTGFSYFEPAKKIGAEPKLPILLISPAGIEGASGLRSGFTDNTFPPPKV